MSERQTISFVGTREMKRMLEAWAKEEDRSISYLVRRAILKEARRREREVSLRKAKPLFPA